MHRLEKFAAAYDEALKTIETFRTDAQNGDLRKLTEWLLATDANPYAFLPEDWAGSMGTAEGFADLLNHIYHAVFDDGDLAVVRVNGEPRLVFACPHDDGFEERCLCSTEKSIRQRRDFKFTVEVLDIDVNDFGDIYNQYQVTDLQRCFAMDAARNSIKFANEHYKMYACWTDKWAEECADQIAKWAKFYGKTA